MLTKTEHKTNICRKSYKNIFKHFTTECHPVKAWLHVKLLHKNLQLVSSNYAYKTSWGSFFVFFGKLSFIVFDNLHTTKTVVDHRLLPPITNDWPHKAKIKPEKKTFYVFFKVHVDQIDQIIATHIYWPHGRKEKAKMFRQFLSAAGQ